MLNAIAQLAGKVEVTEGTAIALAAADAVLHADGKFTPDTPMTERPLRTTSLSPFAAVPGKRSGDIEFRMELKGSGTAGTPPACGKFLRACGFLETIVAGTSVTYSPASASIPSLTIALYPNGMIEKIWGARGTVKLSCAMGEPAFLTFNFKGADFSVADGANLVGVSYQSTIAPALLSATFTLGSYAALVSKLDFDLANTLHLRPDINASSGFKSVAITARAPVMSIDPETVLAATYDWWTKLRAGTEGALTMTVGATAGNICTITAPKVQYARIAHNEREGFRSLGVDCRLNRSSGDDETVLAFT